jgi:hypothetical protein
MPLPPPPPPLARSHAPFLAPSVPLPLSLALSVCPFLLPFLRPFLCPSVSHPRTLAPSPLPRYLAPSFPRSLTFALLPSLPLSLHFPPAISSLLASITQSLTHCHFPPCRLLIIIIIVFCSLLHPAVYLLLVGPLHQWSLHRSQGSTWSTLKSLPRGSAQDTQQA